MKRLVALLVPLALLCSFADMASAQDMAAKRDAKKAEAWVKNANWIFDYTKAKAEAKKSGKVIFSYFTRSYSP